MMKSTLKIWFDGCRDDLQSAAKEWCYAVGGALDAAHRASDSMRLASQLYHAKRALDQKHAFISKRFLELLQISMTERHGGTESPYRSSTLSADVGLVDDDVVNESIEVSRIAARVLFETEWQIREAEEGLALRLGQKVVAQRTSPFHPEVLARTVWRLTEEMSLNTEERVTCLHVASDATIEFARRLSSIAITWFGPADPTSSFVIRRSAPGVRDVRIPVDILFVGNEPPEERHDAASAIAATSKSLRPLDSRDQVFRDLISGIELVLSDVRLTFELRRVLSGFQMMAMRFALASPEIFYSPQHELWSMNRRLADYVLVHCLRDRVAQDDFILFADHQLQLMLAIDACSLGGLAPRLSAIENFVRLRPYQLIENEKHTMQDFARQESDRRRAIGATITLHRERIDLEIGRTEVPFRLRQFMLADWAEVLARTEISDGLRSKTFEEYWGAIRRMVALIKDSAGLAARAPEKAAEINAVLEVLERGMTRVTMPSVEKHELASIFLRPVVRRPEWLDCDLQPDLLMGNSRVHRQQQSFWGARESESRSPTVMSTAGLTSAVPASDAEYWVNTLRIGTVIEIFLLGTWLETRVTSITGAGNLFVLRDESEDCSHPLTRRALLRLVREGLAGPFGRTS